MPIPTRASGGSDQRRPRRDGSSGIPQRPIRRRAEEEQQHRPRQRQYREEYSDYDEEPRSPQRRRSDESPRRRSQESDRRLGEERRPRRAPIQNEYDDEDPFSSVPIDEQFEDDDYYEEEIRRPQRRREESEDSFVRRRRRPNPEPQYQEQEYDDFEDDNLGLEDSSKIVNEEDFKQSSAPKSKSRKTFKKERERKQDESGRDLFIDEEQAKLKTFGARKEKVADYDEEKRTNLRKKATIVQFVVIAIVLSILGFAIFKVIVPTKTLTEDDVASIISDQVGITDFPLERGKGFAKDFLQAYLNIGPSTTDANVLGYYYTGALNPNSNPSRSVRSNYRQNILYGPTVYSAKSISNTSGSYVIGAFVDGSTDKVPAAKDGTSAHWLFFNINVYYDKKTDSLAITPESPTMVPDVGVKSQTEVPQEADLGTGEQNQDIASSISSTVTGFIKAYSESSTTDHSSLDQYIIPDPPVELTSGLSGKITLAGSESDAIQFKAYNTTDPDTLKVAVDVTWRDNFKADSELKSGVDYKSSYVMTLSKQSNGKYLVSKFAPKYYIASQKG